MFQADPIGGTSARAPVSGRSGGPRHEGSADVGRDATVHHREEARLRPQTPRRAGRPDLGVGGVDHRLRVAVRAAGGARGRRAVRDDQLGDRRPDDRGPGPGPRRARGHVPGLRWHRSVPPLRLRRRRRRVVRVVLLAPGGHGRADRGAGHADLHGRLQLGLGLDRPGDERAERHRHPRVGHLDGGLHGGELPGSAAAGGREQRDHLVEDRDPPADHPRAGPDQLRQQQRPRGERVRPGGPQGSVQRPGDGRHHLQLPGLRAGRPAGRRGGQPQARHPLGHHRLGPDRDGPLRAAPGRLPVRPAQERDR